MSVKIMAWVFETRGMNSAEKLVALALADHAHDDGTEARPGQARLIEKTELSEQTVRRAIKGLLEKGFLSVDREATNNMPTWYKFELFRGTNLEPQASSEVPSQQSGGTTTAPLEVPPRHPNHHEPSINHHVDKSDDSPRKKGRPRTKPEPSYTPEFEEFYRFYPKPLNKEQTFKNWNWTISTRGATPASIMGAVRVYLKEIERKATDPDFFIVSANFVGQKQRWTEFTPATIAPETLAAAQAWDAYDEALPAYTPEPPFPRPTDSKGYLLDREGRSYYIDPMDYKRRYVDDE